MGASKNLYVSELPLSASTTGHNPLPCGDRSYNQLFAQKKISNSKPTNISLFGPFVGALIHFFHARATPIHPSKIKVLSVSLNHHRFPLEDCFQLIVSVVISPNQDLLVCSILNALYHVTLFAIFPRVVSYFCLLQHSPFETASIHVPQNLHS